MGWQSSGEIFKRACEVFDRTDARGRFHINEAGGVYMLTALQLFEPWRAYGPHLDMKERTKRHLLSLWYRGDVYEWF